MLSIKRVDKNEALQIAAALILILVIVVPILLLARYAMLGTDDFGHVMYAGSGTSLGDLIKAGWDKAVAFYATWQGTYFGGFIIGAAGPLLKAGIQNISVVLLLFDVIFFISLYLLIRTVVKYCCKVPKLSVALWLYAGAALLMTQFVGTGEYYYWLSGMSVYSMPMAMIMLGLASFVMALSHKKTWQKTVWMVIAGIACFLAMGGTLAYPLFLCSLLFVGTIVLWRRKSPYKKLVTILFAIAIIGFMINATAPGNWIRRGVIAENGAPLSVPRAGVLAFMFVVEQFALHAPEAIFVAIALFPVFMLLVKRTNYPFAHPLLCAVLALLLNWALWFLDLYATGWPGERYLTGVNNFMVLISMFIEFYFCGWLYKRFAFELGDISKKVMVALAVIVAFSSFVVAKPLQEWNTYKIVDGFYHGTIQKTHAEYERILSDIENSPDASVLLEPPQAKFDLLYNLGLSTDPTAWQNSAISKYFGKDSVAIISKEN